MSDTLRSALCRRQEPTFQLWLSLGKVTAYLFEHPAIAVLIAMGAAAMLWWLANRFLAKKTRRLLAVGFVCVCLFVASPIPSALSQQLLVSFLPADTGESAEAIVILGRGASANQSRVAEAAKLWRDKRAPLIFVSGRVDAPIVCGLLKKQEQIPKSVIVQERCSLSTSENAEFTAAIMLPRNLSKIILVTDPLHMLRSHLTFKSYGFEVIPHPVALPPDQQSQFLTFRESLGALSYGLSGRYFSKEISEETIVEADKLVAQQHKKGVGTAIERY